VKVIIGKMRKEALKIINDAIFRYCLCVDGFMIILDNGTTVGNIVLTIITGGP